MEISSCHSNGLVDDFYFAVLSDEDELFPISDEKYAGELQFQEALMSSVVANLQYQPHKSNEVSVGSSNNHVEVQNPAKFEAGESSGTVCDICMEAKSTQEMFRSNNCSHAFCSDCVSKHIAAKIQENILMVRCPSLKCEGIIEPDGCRSIVPADVFERWEDALCESMVLGSQRVYCPFKDCSALLIDDGGDVVARESECPNCHRLFCAGCKVPWHSGIECEDYMQLSKDENGRDDLMVMELANKSSWKRCPRCKFYVEKTEGCLHIVCRCGVQFCYGCGSVWSESHSAACSPC